MPKPGKVEEKKKTKEGGSGSGSWRALLQQRNESQEAMYRDTIESVCEKINTLRVTQTGTIEEYNTFVYKGDSDEELEDQGTILKKDVLEQYTEELETFVFKGFDDSDSDYFTGGSLGNKDSKKKGEESDNDNDEDVSRTLLRQYSETLAANDEDNGDGTLMSVDRKVEVVTKTEVDGPSARVHAQVQKSCVELGNTRLGNLESDDEEDDAFEETVQIQSISKYQYKGLKDTFALRKGKRNKRPVSNPDELFSPVRDDDYDNNTVNRKSVPNGSPGKSKSVSMSLSSTGDFNGARHRTEDPRLLATLECHSLKKSRAPKVPISDRIEQSLMNRAESDKRKAGRMAFTDGNNLNDLNEEEDFDVGNVMSHLKNNITPFSSVDTQSETIRPANTDVFKSQVNVLKVLLVMIFLIRCVTNIVFTKQNPLSKSRMFLLNF